MEESIETFFNDRSVFVTGGTGFMGKVLIEKLARSCPGIKKIYLLTRPSKKGRTCDERISDMLSLPLFDRIKKEQPGQIEKKLYPIQGDIRQLGLAISDADRKLLIDNVSVIFHAAASVRFDDPVNDAIIINTRGTREVARLAKDLKNLAVFVHVSTTFCNCYRQTVEEVVYPAPLNWQEAIHVAETIDKEAMSILSQKYLGFFPNSYVLAKNLAERILEDECQDIPTVIFRPSIVIGAHKEPVPGWIDTFHGPIGLFIGIGKGVIRTAFTCSTTRPDYMPVDIAIKGMIVAAWKKAVINAKEPGITIYNSATGYKSIIMEELVKIGMEFCYKYPFVDSLWIPQIMLTSDKTCFYVNTIIKQVVPAVLIDFVCKLTNQKPLNLVKLQRKIYQASMALSHFTSNNWYFINTNFLDLLKYIPEQDRQAFDFSFQDVDPAHYLNEAILGGHQYLLHTDITTLPAAVKRYKKMKIIHNTIKAVFLSWVLWYLWTLVSSYFHTIVS